MKPNWKKGIYRLWLGLAVVWWIGGAIFGIHLFTANEFHHFPTQKTDWEAIVLYLLIWPLSPLVIAGFWKAGAWTIQGFKENWKKGIYRLWLGFAVVWQVVLLGIALVDSPSKDYYVFTFWVLLMGILPPLVIAGFWKGGAWIIKGFIAEKPPIIKDKEDNKE